ncbi:MAG: type VI secretion system ATPase TssH [Candidatus Marinimicrobia bacterium]|nr:type VI secretion system ATPase TssH [Candidatus Neomarinimicrobiota bacterium]|tara:strand:+ start:586 stop:2691 length:2106 start_codon:yes stop_codon:yes gene_type:complete
MENKQQINPEKNVNVLEAYGIDLTQHARDGKIDPVIGREDEIRRIIQILSRRTKNNPVLIGEPGTGKTTVAEGLARRIIEGDVPENLKKSRLIGLDLSAMIAGAMFRGQFEERLKNFVKKVVKSEGEIIVFIDEIHTIVGAGAMEGQMDVSNMIKPELAKGRMKVIGATTLNEYQKYIEKDAALERRFQQVYIAEPNVEDTVTILRGIKDKYEIHHGLRIKDSALISAASLSNRYISDRFLPDKAVDLVDEAAAKIRMEMNSAPESIDNARRNLLQLEIEKEAIKKERDFKSKERMIEIKKEIKLIKSTLSTLTIKWEEEKVKVKQLNKLKEKMEIIQNNADRFEREGNLQGTARIRYNDIPELDKKIELSSQDILTNTFIKLEVENEDIAEVVSKWTGIPVTKMLSGEQEKLMELEFQLERRVKGQSEAVSRTADVIRMSKMGMVDEDRPVGSFLFLGNTGVGKTELAKSLAEILFDDEKALTRFDMSEFMESHSVSKLIGSPPGYVGYSEGGQLTEKIRRRPYAVVLFDEIEKAHPDVLNVLLQLLDDGRLTDSKGRTVNFKNVIVIMTSNMKRSDLNQFLRPEFINRIDEVMSFNDLDKDVVKEIVIMKLNLLHRKFNKLNIQVNINESVINYLVKNGFDSQFGARPVNRLIKRDILAQLSKQMIQEPENRNVNILVENKKIIIKMRREKSEELSINY